MNIETGTFTEATSPSLKALATMAQNKTVVPIAIIPKSNKRKILPGSKTAKKTLKKKEKAVSKKKQNKGIKVI